MGGAFLPFGGRLRVLGMAAFCGSILGRLVADAFSSGLSWEFGAVGFLLAPLLAFAYINSKAAAEPPEPPQDDTD